MVCALKSGFSKSHYRIFKVKDKKTNKYDDYGILKEVLTRRFSKLDASDTPELVLIDGGKGHLSIAKQVKEKLSLHNINFVAIAKGEKRNAGEESLIFENNTILKLSKTSSTLHFIQLLRDEAHRFAIKSMRRSKTKTISYSKLDDIPTIGNKRKKILLNHFGSIQNIEKASIDEITKTPGISKAIAIKIFNWFN